MGFSKFEKQPISSEKLTSIENCNIKISQKKKMKKYRGKGYKNYNENHLNNLKILLLNIRGFKSKEVSLQNVTKLFHPSIIVLNETQLVGRENVKIENYISWSKNRTSRPGGGIATLVSKTLKESAIEIEQGDEDDEIIFTKILCYKKPMNIINYYGEQRRSKNEILEKKWNILTEKMENSIKNNEYVVLCGYLNRFGGM